MLGVSAVVGCRLAEALDSHFVVAELHNFGTRGLVAAR